MITRVPHYPYPIPCHMYEIQVGHTSSIFFPVISIPLVSVSEKSIRSTKDLKRSSSSTLSISTVTTMATSSLSNFLSLLSPSSSTQPQTKKPPNQLNPPPPLSSDSLPTLRTTHRPITSSLIAEEGFSPSSSKDLMSVICPSLAYANTLFFKAPLNAMIMPAEDEPEEVLLRRFRREVMKTGVIPEVKRRRYFENTQDERKRRIRDLAKKNKRRRTPFRPRDDMVKEEVSKEKDDDLDEDNWEVSN